MPTTEELAVKIEGVDSRGRSNTNRNNKLEERQDNMEQRGRPGKGAGAHQGRRDRDKVDVKTLAEKPGKRWDGLVEKVVWAVAGAVIVYLLGQIGL